MDIKCEEVINDLSTSSFTQEAYEFLVDGLAEIYVQNCGVSISMRTIAHIFAVALIENHKKLGFYEAVALFDAIMDGKDEEHSKYDITYLNEEEMMQAFSLFAEKNAKFFEKWHKIAKIQCGFLSKE